MNETVSLVGRTNVGKSSLFNKLIKSKSAIVSNHEGLTRDIKVAELQYFNRAVNLVDTGGFFTSKDDDFEDLIIAKAYEAIEQSDKVIFVVDKKFGLSPYDKAIANIVRKSGKRSLLVINKIDVKTDEGIEIFYELGFDDFVTVSAEHNLNIDILVEKIFEDIKEDEKDDAHNIPRISIIGKPNVGKSSSINTILKEDKMIVSDIPGTTIDSVDTRVEFKGKEYIFADTAGIRRKNKTTEKEEKFSVIKSLNAVEEANLCLVFQDASDCLKEQDLKIVERAKEIGKAIIVVINKTDLLNREQLSELKKNISNEPALNGLPCCFISAMENKGFRSLFDQIYRVLQNADTNISTNKLNKILSQAKEAKSIPYKGKFKPKIRYIHQGGKNPHILTLHGNSLEKLEGSYQRFLTNFFHKKLNLSGITIKLKFINSKNPYN